MDKENQHPAATAFLNYLNSLPRGELSRISRETNIPLSRLSSIKTGGKSDIRISTFATIASACHAPAGVILGIESKNGEDPMIAVAKKIAQAEVEQYKKRAMRVLEAAESLLGPQEIAERDTRT